LAEALRGRADAFTFNRLAMVGEGKNLSLPEPEEFQAFLKAYREAASANPMMTLKDNLFNTLSGKTDNSPAGGCTGYGCGAAFNFVSLLPDGEVHACRKFPSPIGSIKENSLLDIFQSRAARRYRNGAEECRGCDLFTVCRGCLAVVYGMGLDCFKSRDPFCLYKE
jgi:selenobiotic family peptide radical SAM maturase